MKDRFRFRAWNKEEKKMYYDAQDTYDYIVGKPIIFAESFGCLLTNDEEWDVEQCTGFSDKNGKLIYEGDIVSDGYVKRTVMWDGWYWNAKAVANCPLDNITCSIVEIVGNIHEQAEQKDK